MNGWRSSRETAIRIDVMKQSPLYIRVHPNDNVAIVVNDGGLGEGAVFPDGLALRERVPQGHKVALADLAEGDEVVRYNVVIGYALKALPKGSWINEHVIRMPSPPGLEGLPIATVKAPVMPPLEGFTFEGYRNADGSAGSRNRRMWVRKRLILTATSKSSGVRSRHCSNVVRSGSR